MGDSMILNTHVPGDEAAARESATWLGTYAERVHQAASAATRARVDSNNAWAGPAGKAFREAVTPLGSDGDRIGENTTKLKQGLEAFADALATVNGKMHDARGKATAGGLKVTPKEIWPPEPAPPAPPMTSGRSPQSPADAQQMSAEHNAAMDAYNGAVDRVNAQAKVFNECRALVDDARNIEKNAHTALVQVATGVADWVRTAKTLTSQAAGTVASMIKGGQGSINDLNKLAVELTDAGNIFEKVSTNQLLNATDRTTLAAWSADSHTKAESHAARAGQIDRMMSKIPESARTAIEWNAGNLIKDPTSILGKGGKTILKGLPVVGTTLSVASSVGDVIMGEDPGKAAAKLGGGLAGGVVGGWAGGALGGAIAGSSVPGVGTIVGGLIGGLVGTVGTTEIIDSSMGDG
ncbi:hypothetical protein [Amycolatopsis antarctica]|nr:hypothetical protein [Amycolatopsis antarctica]